MQLVTRRNNLSYVLAPSVGNDQLAPTRECALQGGTWLGWREYGVRESLLIRPRKLDHSHAPTDAVQLLGARDHRQSTDCSSVPISAGLRVTLMPEASITSSFSCAVPLPPEMIAPACPIRLPGGAVTPAMKPTTGFFM